MNCAAPPVVTVFPPSPAQLQSHTVTLLCVSSQSGPFAQVSWLVDGSPVSSGVWSSGAVLGEENTFHMSSSLSIPTSHWNTGQQLYTCRVSWALRHRHRTPSGVVCVAPTSAALRSCSVLLFDLQSAQSYVSFV
ncbi:hypothetical protein WMY93_025591 [Mugilogobius chulae]|uniref:Ig-like domain-containing protein n=1 Tax=Mugilogobius chulae TaxID=88201 RepID=A0AAW0N0T3_9GOBI